MSSSGANEVEQRQNVSFHHATKLDEMLKEMATANKTNKVSLSQPQQDNSRRLVITCMPCRDDDQQAEEIRALPKFSILNSTKGDLTEGGTKDWSGEVFSTYPPKIVKNDIGGFQHGDVDDSEGVVVYLGTNGDVACAWILAWKVTAYERKIYVEAGPYEKYKGSYFWKDIPQKVKSIGAAESYMKHNNTGAEASAKIGNGSDFTAAILFGVTTTKQ